MPDHIRHQIRDAAGDAVTGLLTAGTRVFKSRIYPLTDAEMPALLVYTTTEDSERDGMGETLARSLSLVVEGYIKSSATIDNQLDKLSAEVESAMASDRTLGGLARDCYLSGTEINFTGDGEVPIGVVTMTFLITYFTKMQTPTVAI
jgi:hypothetical protein